MTDLKMIRDTLTKKKSKLIESGISQIGIFGSYVRGEENTNSDVYILIDLVRPVKPDILDLISLEQELSDPVDLVLKSTLKPIINESVLSEVQYL